MNASRVAGPRASPRPRPVTYVIFDLLWLDGHSLMERPYDERRAALATLGLDGGEHWRTPTQLAGSGRDILAATRAQRPRGDRREAPRRPLRARAAQRRVGQDQEHPAPASSSIGGWTTGQRAAARADRRAAGGSARPQRARCATPAVSGAASPSTTSTRSRRRSRRSCGRTPRSRPTARSRRAAPSSANRGWSCEVEFSRVDPRRRSCAQPSFKGTRGRRRAAARRA